jgi:N-acetylneuraminate lyase
MGAIASAAPSLPFYYYHIPSATNVDLPMVDFLAVADGLIQNLAGIKYTHYDLEDLQLCLHYGGGKYNILFGRDQYLLAAVALGVRGAVGSTYS